MKILIGILGMMIGWIGWAPYIKTTCVKGRDDVDSSVLLCDSLDKISDKNIDAIGYWTIPCKTNSKKYIHEDSDTKLDTSIVTNTDFQM